MWCRWTSRTIQGRPLCGRQWAHERTGRERCVQASYVTLTMAGQQSAVVDAGTGLLKAGSGPSEKEKERSRRRRKKDGQRRRPGRDKRRLQPAQEAPAPAAYRPMGSPAFIAGGDVKIAHRSARPVVMKLRPGQEQVLAGALSLRESAGLAVLRDAVVHSATRQSRRSTKDDGDATSATQPSTKNCRGGRRGSGIKIFRRFDGVPAPLAHLEQDIWTCIQTAN